MAVEAYAVEEAGRIILPHTIRPTAGDAKTAAMHRVKIKGSRWEALARMFQWRVVRVEVRRVEVRETAAPPAPPPRPSSPRPAPPAPRPVELAGGLGRIGEPTELAGGLEPIGAPDRRSIRLSRSR